MICPHCKSDLAGGLIYDVMLAQYDGDEVRAANAAASYGATKENGKRFGREVAIYSRGLDRTIAFLCPDCGREWERT